jgi:environmental stress-induced protein Ves
MKTLIEKSKYKNMRWSNGLGQTTEIDRYPTSGDVYLWRLSQASITDDCEFSKFPLFDRWLIVLRGGAISLNEKKLEPLRPFRFSGDETTSCRVLESHNVEDLGFIFNRQSVNAEMRVVEGRVDLVQRGELCVHYLYDLKTGDTLKYQNVIQIEISKSVLVSVFKI